MKVVCVICTELLLINSHISVCNCGHIFHEECLFKWLRTGQATCPQCRCKLKEKEIIKRLFLTEYDITSSQQVDLKSVEVTPENFDRLLNKCEELKNNLKDQTEILNTKNKLIEQSEKKLKDNEQLLSNTKKTLSERQLLIDYLKKELENYSKIKDQNDLRQRRIEELELKLREFRSVEMIYKEHEATFATEMNKYLSQATNQHLSQTIIRQLVSTNVLLKEHADKQMEEKRQFRKKLLQIEKQNTDQTKQLEKQEQEIRELRKVNEKLRTDAKLKDNEIRNLKTSSNFLNNQSTPNVNKENILIVNDTIEFEDNNNSCNNKTNDSDLKYIDDWNKLDNKKSLETDDDIINLDNTPSPMFMKKRKNPFVTNQDDEDDEIRPNQGVNNNKTKFQKFKSFNELSLSQRFKESPIDIEIVKPILSNLKKSRLNLNDQTSSGLPTNSTSSISSSNSSNIKAFNYLSDGLGGRSKVTNSSTTSSSSNVIKPKKQNFLTKFKVSLN